MASPRLKLTKILVSFMGFAMPQFSRKCLVFIIAMLNAFGAHATAEAKDINTLISSVRAAGHDIPEADRMVASCDGDAMCAARFLKDSIGDAASIVPALDRRPTRTGWSDRKAPMRVVPDPSSGAIVIEFYRLDADFLSNLLNRLAAVPKKMIIDIRRLHLSDDLGDIQRTVSLFTGRIDRAFRLIHATGREVDWQIPKAKTIWPDEDIVVQIGGQTPGNGLAFAALLKRYADAKIKGGILPEQIFVHQIVAITHGWDMLVPSAEVRLPD